MEIAFVTVVSCR